MLVAKVFYTKMAGSTIILNSGTYCTPYKVTNLTKRHFCSYCVYFLGQYGIPRPWYFPFQKSYWCDVASNTVEVDAVGNQQRPSETARRTNWVC